MCGNAGFTPERNPVHGDLFVEDSSKRCMIVLSNSSTPGGLVIDGAGEMCTPSLSDPAISGYYVDTNEGFAFARTWMWEHATFIPREAEDAA